MSCLLAAAPFRQDLPQTPPLPIVFLAPMTFLPLVPFIPLYYLPGPAGFYDPRISIFMVSFPIFVLHISAIFHVKLINEIGPMLDFQLIFRHTFCAILVIEQSPSLTNFTKNFH